MIDMNAWLAEAEATHEAPRAVRAWNRIQDKPTSVVFKTPGTNPTVLSAQTVRIESDNNATESESGAGRTPVRKVVVFGVQNHPDSAVSDTNMADGYRFIYLGDEYRIVDIISNLGELQGIGEAVG